MAGGPTHEISADDLRKVIGASVLAAKAAHSRTPSHVKAIHADSHARFPHSEEARSAYVGHRLHLHEIASRGTGQGHNVRRKVAGSPTHPTGGGSKISLPQRSRRPAHHTGYRGQR